MTNAPWLRSLPALTGVAPDLDGADLDGAYLDGAYLDSAEPADPIRLVEGWLRHAVDAGVPEPHAVTLATVDDEGVPDARTLLLKDIGERGFAVAGPRRSRKAAQLAVHPAAALSFWWQPLVRAIRIRGSVVEASPEESAADLAARSAAARAGVAPGDWVRWWIEPTRIEFWQGAPDRRHSRIVCTRADGAWRREDQG